MRKLIIALTLAAAATAAGAQQIYKYATPDGNVVYTDNPAAGLNGARKLAMPTLAVAAVSPRLYDQERSAPTGGAVGEGVSAAQTEYREAKRRRIDGVTPLAEERIGPYFHPEYWQRQRALRQGMLLASTRVAQTQQAQLQAQAPMQMLAAR